MRRLISYLFVAVLGTLSIWGGLSCRAIHMLSTSADSTATRSEESSQKWDRETTTKEFVFLPSDTIFQDRYIDRPIIHYRERTTRDKGEVNEKKDEEKSVSTETKEVDKSTPVMTQVTQMLAAAAFLGVIILLFKKT
jgi:hypothetical protein